MIKKIIGKYADAFKTLALRIRKDAMLYAIVALIAIVGLYSVANAFGLNKASMILRAIIAIGFPAIIVAIVWDNALRVMNKRY